MSWGLFLTRNGSGNLRKINIGHFVLLSTIYQHLSTHLTPDTWGTLETRALCKMGDHLVSLYDRPLEVIDLTQDDAGAN